MLPNRENNGEILWDVVGGHSTDEIFDRSPYSGTFI
jgi:hypothetical protein